MSRGLSQTKLAAELGVPQNTFAVTTSGVPGTVQPGAGGFSGSPISAYECVGVALGTFVPCFTSTTRSAVLPSAPDFSVTITGVPTTKADALAGTALVPYWVAESMVTCCVAPARVVIVQVEPAIAWIVPRTDELRIRALFRAAAAGEADAAGVVDADAAVA